MTNKRENDNDEMDKLVAETYRKTANETAPEHLNERVLKMAANPDLTERRPAWLVSAWTRPLAWAATAALSLAIVLEVAQVSDLSQANDTATHQVESVRDDFVPKDTETLDQARDRARLQNGSNQEREFTSETELTCAADTRETASAWFACIRELRTSGQAHAAAREFENFALKYPDFVPDK